MVMAKLHIICGNCGCNDNFEWEYKEREEVESDVFQDEDVYLWCMNCCTLHSINNNAKIKEK